MQTSFLNFFIFQKLNILFFHIITLFIQAKQKITNVISTNIFFKYLYF